VATHIGQEIRKRVKERGVAITMFAQRIGCTPKTVHALFKRPSIDTMLLKRCSEELAFDFFSLYSEELRLPGNQGPSRTAEPPAKYAARSGNSELEIVIRPGGDKEMLDRVLKAIDQRKGDG
jgi:hypothetical protein